MLRTLLVLIAISIANRPALASTFRVPKDYKTIQAAINAANANDTVVVAPGKYVERIRLKPGVKVHGEKSRGMWQAEDIIIDGGGNVGKDPGVVMAEGSALFGVTITNVGVFNAQLWKKHFDSKGEELGDEEGSVQAEGTTPAISIQGVSCIVSHCILKLNGDVGVGILGKNDKETRPIISHNLVVKNMGGGIGVAEGATPIVEKNTCQENLRAGIGCRNANPVIISNVCQGNVRAGIGCREGARPIIRGNQCFQNRRAGIGIRMPGTAPIVEGNECYENSMAGIGCRDDATPVIRRNICRNNKMAGIGCRDGAKPLILENECKKNDMAGIGVQQKGSATIVGNKCHDNKLVAIGVIEGSTALIQGNEMSRTGGMPPLIAVKNGSSATVRDNQIHGGGVAAILVEGNAFINSNVFTGIGQKQGTAVWVWAGSNATINNNQFDGYGKAINASKSTMRVTDNKVSNFRSIAITIKQSSSPCLVQGNIAFSSDAKARVVDIQGPTGVVADNELRKIKDVKKEKAS